MGQENFLGCLFSSLFTKNKVAKGSIFTTALQKDKSNPNYGSSLKNSIFRGGGGYEKPINRSGDCLKKEDIAKKRSDVFEGG